MKTRQQIIDDGREADRLLKDTDLRRFLDEIEQDCWLEFKATETNDSSSREAIYTGHEYHLGECRLCLGVQTLPLLSCHMLDCHMLEPEVF